MTTIQCPHCAAANDSNSAFCESCGKALPGGATEGPRVVGGDQFAATHAGQSLQADELAKQAKKASVALLAVAILQVIFGTLLLLAGGMRSDQNIELTPFVFVAVYGIGLLFFALYLWARKSPLPAAIAGLVLFVTVHALDALVDPTALVRGIILKIIIIAVLLSAISAGVRHRRLMGQMQTSYPS
jgi:hypothetical protein